MAMTKKQVIKKIMSHLDTLFTGSGDLEKDDAVDVQEYLTKTFGEKHNDFKVVLQGIMAMVETLDPSWLVCRGPLANNVPCTTTTRFWRGNRAVHQPLADRLRKERQRQGEVEHNEHPWSR